MNLIFDCDDTLYDCSWPFKMAVKEALPPKECDVIAFYRTYREIGERVFHLMHEGIITTDESGFIRISESAPQYGFEIDKDTAVLFQQTYKSYQGKISIHPVLKDYLMNTHHSIAILTNGVDKHQRNKLKALNVSDFVDPKYIYTSEEVGYSKPDKRLFDFALEKWEMLPEESFYIGDNYQKDMEGAKNAGMKTIYMNRHRNEEGPACDYIVYDDEQLVELLKSFL